jgi:hypothetical protein
MTRPPRGWLLAAAVAVSTVSLVVVAVVSVLAWQEQKRQSCIAEVHAAGLAFIAGDYARDADDTYRKDLAVGLTDDASAC